MPPLQQPPASPKGLGVAHSLHMYGSACSSSYCGVHSDENKTHTARRQHKVTDNCLHICDACLQPEGKLAYHKQPACAVTDEVSRCFSPCLQILLLLCTKVLVSTFKNPIVHRIIAICSDQGKYEILDRRGNSLEDQLDWLMLRRSLSVSSHRELSAPA